MNFTMPHGGMMSGIVALAIIASVVTTLFWMYVGWRAMRAHERIAETLESVVRMDAVARAIHERSQS